MFWYKIALQILKLFYAKVVPERVRFENQRVSLRMFVCAFPRQENVEFRENLIFI